MNKKSELRQEILKIRDGLSLETRTEKSKLITNKIVAHKKYQEAEGILLFVTYKSEVETKNIFQDAIEQGKRVYFPRVSGDTMDFYHVASRDELIEGYKGILEPQENPLKRFEPQNNEKILVIMPGAVFDKEGNRIGYGGGFYDKYLSWLSSQVSEENIATMAVAFACQVVEVGIIPTEVHDRKVDILITK